MGFDVPLYLFVVSVNRSPEIVTVESPNYRLLRHLHQVYHQKDVKAHCLILKLPVITALRSHLLPASTILERQMISWHLDVSNARITQ
jgi:hypothetical protein